MHEMKWRILNKYELIETEKLKPETAWTIFFLQNTQMFGFEHFRYWDKYLLY